ncbi:hypothetical protein [Croceiramulus getboli]|nr:hypothetical protein P8624_06560 [Flavobacteriaceae bacterium YJPT1-3]
MKMTIVKCILVAFSFIYSSAWIGYAEHPTDSTKTRTTSQNQLNYLQQLAQYRKPLPVNNN